MPTISLCMIVKNEEAVLARCLTSVADLVDEIIIVDTGSEDKTREIAETFTSKVYDFDWIDDFAAARNYSFSFATKDYCMWLDADDVLFEQDRALFQELKKTLSDSVQTVMLKYNTAFDSYGNPAFSYYRERIIKNYTQMKWIGAIHEVIEPIGMIIYSECAISHQKLAVSDPDRNLRIFENQLNNGVVLEPRMQFYYARELYYHHRYQDAIEAFEHFLSDEMGWIENKIDACCHLAYCYYELYMDENALHSLLKSLSYDRPRAEVCCQIGHHFFEREKYDLAVYWYEVALTCKREDNRGGFVSPDCYGYLPCIQLCVCFWKLNQLEKAKVFNELAGKCKPEDETVKQNQLFFNSLQHPEE